MSLPISVAGAGLVGLSCAQAPEAIGSAVEVFDMRRGFGGRMATRRVDTSLGLASFDHGPGA